MLKRSVARTASKGVVIGKAYVHEEISLEPSQALIEAGQAEAELEKFAKATASVTAELQQLAETNEIFAAHLEMAQDPTLSDSVRAKVEGENLNAELALANAVDELVMIFESMDDEYMRERAADIKDVSKRLMAALQGKSLAGFSDISEPVILVARDLFPSDTANLNLEYTLGFITQEGGVTSHVSIMARNQGIPALVGVEGILDDVKAGDLICMDAKTGEIVINPDEATKAEYAEKKTAFEKRQKELEQLYDLDAETTDGRLVQICANVGNVEETVQAMTRKVDGVGLFRSEFLYMENTHFPTEEEQFEVYRDAAKACPEELTIRTLDIGGDKELSYYKFETEENPFLGWRALRISLELKDMFKEQLRAILRASTYGHIRIMFPMIISIEELREAKAVLDECKKELDAEGIPYDLGIETGMMIETPASVLLVEEFAKEADFFSIGTNDLTQYLLAVDRGNKKISHMYNSYHPAVLGAINRIIKAAHAEDIKAGMCGEFASDTQATKVLLGMGLDEFSVSSSESAAVKEVIRETAFADAEKLAEQVLACSTVKEVMDVINA